MLECLEGLRRQPLRFATLTRREQLTRRAVFAAVAQVSGPQSRKSRTEKCRAHSPLIWEKMRPFAQLVISTLGQPMLTNS